jgi:hypothetical protein
VDVLAGLEGLAKLRFARHVGEDSQLDLRVVGREQLVPRLGDEGRADLAAELGADRDRLQVRARRRKAPGRRDGLVEGRVQAAVLADQRRERAEVGVEQLRILAPLLDHADDRVLAADRAEDARVGRVAGLALAPGGQLELLEQDPRDLLGRAEHELLARQLVSLRLELLDPVGEARGDLAHPVRVDLDARGLHRREHLGQGQLDLAVERLRPALADALEQRVAQAQRRSRMADERRRLLLGLGDGQELDPILGREVVEHVLGPARLDQVREDHRVVHGLDPQRLGVVRDQLALEPLRPRRDDDLVAHRGGDPPLVGGDAHGPASK